MSGTIILPKSAVKEANRQAKENNKKKMFDYWTEDNSEYLKLNFKYLKPMKNKIMDLYNLYLDNKNEDKSSETFGYLDILHKVIHGGYLNYYGLTEVEFVQLINVFNDNLINFGITLGSHLELVRNYKEKPVWTAQEIASVRGNVAQLDAVYQAQMQGQMRQLQIQFTDICERLFDCILYVIGVKSAHSEIRTAAINEFFPSSIEDPIELLDIYRKLIEALENKLGTID